MCLSTFCFCRCGTRSSPSLGPVCCWSQLTVYCNPPDSFLWPHFYEFSISPLYCVSRPFIKQYFAAMFAYFLSLWPRNQNRSLHWVSAGPAALPVLSLDSSRVKVTWGHAGVGFCCSIYLVNGAPSSGCMYFGSPGSHGAWAQLTQVEVEIWPTMHCCGKEAGYRGC